MLQRIHEILKAMREDRGWSQTEMAEKLGISPSVVSRRESGLYKWTPFDIKQAASVLGVTVDDINGQLAASARREESTGIPVLNRAPAGELIDYEEYGIDGGHWYEYLDRSAATKGPDLFAVVVLGQSMCPKLEEGDTVVLRPVRAADPDSVVKAGQVVFALLDGGMGGDASYTLAQWWPIRGKPAEIRLHKVNPDFEGRVVMKSAIKGLAVAIEKRCRM
jgi:repressor LexA